MPKRASKPKVSRWLQLSAAQVGTYNCWDILATAQLAKRLPDEMARKGNPAYYEREVWPTVPVVLAMQRRGLGVDDLAREVIRANLEAELAETDATIREVAPDINLGSPVQKAKLLFDTLGLKSRKTTEKGARSTDLEALAAVLRNLRKGDEHARPVLYALFHRSRINTILQRYLGVFTRDGRMYPRIKFAGTKTERLAYADPAVQQFPKEVRGMVCAAPGCVLVSADFSQLEARILAVLAADKPSLEAFASGQDIHCSNGADLFGRVVAKPSPEREFAKDFLYGISYGGAAETIKAKLFCPCPKCEKADTLELPRATMRSMADRWFAKHHAVLKFREALRQQVTRFHYWESPFGGKRWVFGPWSAVEREMYNFPMQSCAARITNRAMVRLHNRGAPIVLQMHDSIMLEVPAQDADHWAGVLREEMEQPVFELGMTVFPVDVSVGERWSEL